MGNAYFHLVLMAPVHLDGCSRKAEEERWNVELEVLGVCFGGECCFQVRRHSEPVKMWSSGSRVRGGTAVACRLTKVAA